MKLQTIAVKLRPFSFGPNSELFKVSELGDVQSALDLAASLAGGINQLSQRLDEAVNNDGAIIFSGELRSLSFLGEVVEALVRSAALGFEDSQIEDSK